MFTPKPGPYRRAQASDTAANELKARGRRPSGGHDAPPAWNQRGIPALLNSRPSTGNDASELKTKDHLPRRPGFNTHFPLLRSEAPTRSLHNMNPRLPIRLNVSSLLLTSTALLTIPALPSASSCRAARWAIRRSAGRRARNTRQALVGRFGRCSLRYDERPIERRGKSPRKAALQSSAARCWSTAAN